MQFLAVSLPLFFARTLGAACSWLALAGAAGDDSLHYRYDRPFLQPLPLWDYWYLMLLPLCLGVAVVYKSVRCREMKEVPAQSAVLFLWILGGIALAGGALWALVWFVNR